MAERQEEQNEREQIHENNQNGGGYNNPLND